MQIEKAKNEDKQIQNLEKVFQVGLVASVIIQIPFSVNNHMENKVLPYNFSPNTFLSS